MTLRDYRDYLDDMITSIDDAISFIEGMEYKKFYQDKKTVNAVVRSLEILGEAGKKIPEKIRKKTQDIPWKQICGMRDKLIHDYFGVDYEMVWKVVKEDLPAIREKLSDLKD